MFSLVPARLRSRSASHTANCKKKMALEVPDYEVRSYTLQAGSPVSIPPARQYILISASASIDAVQLGLGPSNGALSQWPYGISVKVQRPVKSRLASTISQSVTIAFVSGDAELTDDRSSNTVTQSPISTVGLAGLYATGAVAVTTDIVAAAANLNGITVYGAYGAVQATGALDAALHVMADLQPFFSIVSPLGLGTATNTPGALAQQWTIPAGSALKYQNVNATRFALYVNYKVL